MAGWGPFDLGGKNAIVTGGAMGIGFGIASRLAEAGANVLVADMNEEAALKAVDRLAGVGGQAVAMKVDVTEPDAGERMVARCVEAFGSVDILVNNAGIYPFASMMDTTPQLFDKVYSVNLKAVAFIAKAAAARMIEQGRGGKIINIASIDGLHPSMVGLAAYDASKGGVVMLTRNLALEWGPKGILVNAIAPGGINTEGVATAQGGAISPDVIQAMVNRVPLRRFGDPDDIGKVALFLASSAADYMAGEIVVVDGGLLLA